MNTDELHLLEYNRYLGALESGTITGISESIRLFRIDSVKNAIELVKNRENSTANLV